MKIVFVDKKTGKRLRIKRSIKRNAWYLVCGLFGTVMFYAFLCEMIILGEWLKAVM